MSYNITLNSTNVIAGTNNSAYQFTFANGSFDIPEGSEMCIGQITVPYSWVNVSSALGNNVLGYAIPTGANVLQYYSTILPDGYYDITGLNTALQTLFKTNGHYWVNTSSGTYNNVYYYPITLSYNYTLYTTTITSLAIPLSGSIVTTFGTGVSAGSWTGTYPSSVSSYNYASLFIPQTVTSPSSLGYMLGFTGGSSVISPASSNGTFYPTLGVTTAPSISSNGNSLSTPPFNAPLATNVNGVVVRCNLIENKISNNTDILDTFPITSSYGYNINYIPICDNWLKVKKGRYNNVTIYFADQNLNPIKMLDNNVLISLLIRFPQI